MIDQLTYLLGTLAKGSMRVSIVFDGQTSGWLEAGAVEGLEVAGLGRDSCRDTGRGVRSAIPVESLAELPCMDSTVRSGHLCGPPLSHLHCSCNYFSSSHLRQSPLSTKADFKCSGG